MRFLNYLIYDFNFYLKEKLLLALVVFVTIVTQAICMQVGGVIANFILAVTVPLLSLFVVLALYYLASHFGVAFRKKQTSILFLSFPVSVTEKFFVRFINQIILPSFIVLISAMAALGVLALVNCIYPLEYMKALSYLPVHYLFNDTLSPIILRVISLILLSSLLMLVIMMLGSLIFSRYAVIKTFVSYMILSWLITPMLYDQKEMYARTFNLHNNPDPAAFIEFFEYMSPDSFFVGHIIYILVIIVISYILFRRKTIIKPGF